MTTATAIKKEYSKPQLIEMGNAVTLTLGGFIGHTRDIIFGRRLF